MDAAEKASITFVETVENGNIPGLGTKVFQGSDELAEAFLKDPPRPFGKRLLQLYLMCIIPFLCSTACGYDQSLMSSLLVMKPFQNEFGSEVDGIKAGYITAFYQIGGVCAIPFIGESLDRFGRRVGMFIGCFLIVLGAILQGTSSLSHSLGQFLGGRFLLGFGVAISISAAPTWVVETSHPRYRGIITGLFNCTWFIGSILAAGTSRGSVKYTTNQAWLIPVYVQLVFPGIVCIAVLFLPESPRWLYTHGKEQQAKDFLTKYHGNDNEDNAYVQLQVREFETDLQLDGSDKRWWDYRCLFMTRASRYRLACNLLMTAFGQLSSGGVSYYVGAFYSSAGITNPTTVLNFNLGWAFINAGFAYLGASQCDRFGRRKLLMTSLTCMFCMWVAVCVGTGVFSKTGSPSAARAGIAFYLLFSACGAFGITPMQALYITEVVSYEMRGKAMSASFLVNSATSLVNQFGTPVAMQRIGWKTYLIFTIWVLIEDIIVYFVFVETKGYTLEELDRIFEAKNPRKASTQKRTVVVDADTNILGSVKEV